MLVLVMLTLIQLVQLSTLKAAAVQDAECTPEAHRSQLHRLQQRFACYAENAWF